MITRQPKPGDVIEVWQHHMHGQWAPWGTVARLDGDWVYVHEHDKPFLWQFGTDGCLGANGRFRIVPGKPVTMDDPFFH